MKQSIVVKILDGDNIKKEVIFNTDEYQKIDDLVRIYCPNFKEIIDWKLTRVLIFDIEKNFSLSDMDEKLKPLVDGVYNDVKRIEEKVNLLGFEKCYINPNPLNENFYHGNITFGKKVYYFYLKFIHEKNKIKIKKVSFDSSMKK